MQKLSVTNFPDVSDQILEIKKIRKLSAMQLHHKYCRGFSLIAGLCFASAALGQTLPDGTYAETGFGPIELVCVSSVMCHARYENDQSFLYLTSPEQNGRFVGYWAETDADRTCSVVNQFPNIQTNAWGTVDLQFDPSGNSWTGAWGYCDDKAANKFNGARGGQSDQASASVADDQSIKQKLLGSWLPSPDSGARRNDLYTFNPDGSYTISDGSGTGGTGTWKLVNAELFLDGDPVPLSLSGDEIELAGTRFEPYVLNDENYKQQSFNGKFEPSGVFLQIQKSDGASPKIGDYGLRYIILGPSESFEPGGSARSGPPVYVEFWNETEPMKEDEAGNGYRDDIVVFEPQFFEVTSESLAFYGIHPKWGELYFSAEFDGHRIEELTSYALGGRPKPANADQAVIRGDLMVKGHTFHDINLHLGFMH
jgi:hypothetical protein